MEKPFTGMLRVYIFKTTKPSYRDVVSVYTLNTKAQLPECCEFHEHSLYWHVASVYLLNNRAQLPGWCDLIIIWRKMMRVHIALLPGWCEFIWREPIYLVFACVYTLNTKAYLLGCCECVKKAELLEWSENNIVQLLRLQSAKPLSLLLCLCVLLKLMKVINNSQGLNMYKVYLRKAHIGNFIPRHDEWILNIWHWLVLK